MTTVTLAADLADRRADVDTHVLAAILPGTALQAATTGPLPAPRPTDPEGTAPR